MYIDFINKQNGVQKVMASMHFRNILQVFVTKD